MNKQLLPIAFLFVIVILFFWRLFALNKYPEKYEIQGFHYAKQPDSITCGPTSGIMLLDRYNKFTSIDNVKSHAKTQWFIHNGKPIGMTSPELLNKAINQLGVNSSLKNEDLDYLKYCISLDKPVIVLLRSGKLTWHYVLVIGYSENTIIIADPSGGNRSEMTTKNFMGSWKFSTDMEGNSIYSTCSTCSGTGRWGPVRLGPLSVCDVCGGSGYQPDFIGLLLKSADIYPMTSIVPNYSVKP